MSIDNNSQVVRSKYFVGKPAMDDSLSDFQESKQNCKGPKTVQKPVKLKTRQAKKRIKGQKDIRTALKGKKNELISYSKEFDTVCKKSGFDVDSEQLQLAIALSKSLCTETADEPSTSQASTTQSRIAKIKTTLKEYGFKVPESKIATSKRRKKHKEDYKLLTTTEEERKQKITSKYSQVLFENLDHSKLSEDCFTQESITPIYNIGTHITYDCMKDNSIFYVDSLVEKSNTPGTLLRDWAKIPGRPVSPVLLETSTMDFSEIVCSQEELDVILSGCIKSAKHIIATKNVITKVCIDSNIEVQICDHDNKELSGVKEHNIKNNNSVDIEDNILITKETAANGTIILAENEKSSEILDIVDVKSNNELTVREPYRSWSPDIFDDEVSCIMDTSKPILSQGQKTKVFTEETNSMDLTECANNIIINNIEKTQLAFSNITKRKSDDFMEITECAVSASQSICENVKEIDLTQSTDEKSKRIGIKQDSNSHLNYVAESSDCSMNDSDVIIAGNFESTKLTVKAGVHATPNTLEENNKIVDNLVHSQNDVDDNDIVLVDETRQDDIDLTQSSNEDDEKLATIKETSRITGKINETMDLTQSSKSSVDIDDLPEVNIGNTQPLSPNLDDTIILNEEEYKDTNGKVKKSILIQDDQVFDLTQVTNDQERPNNSTSEASSKVCSQSFYEDFVFDHSDNKENAGIELSEDNTSKQSNDIDLTQSSNESERNRASPIPNLVNENIPDNNSLGKRDEISIDYDEICEYESDKECTEECNVVDVNKDSNCIRNDSSKSIACGDLEIVDSNNDLVSNLSQHSEVFDLTDKELDYSVHKSRYDVAVDDYNFDFGGISVMDDITGVKDGKESMGQRTSKHSLRESFLPEVYVKKNEAKDSKASGAKIDEVTVCSPIKIDQNSVPVVTPTNSEYILKTDNVTPMLDYSSMSTPRRNKELDKYGLKPLKRKRAIQILTHLYNQTHPIIQQQSDEDQPSPSKKPRQDTIIPTHTSPKKPANSKKSEGINSNMISPLKKGTGVRISKSPRTSKAGNRGVTSPRNIGNGIEENIVNIYEITSEVPNIREVDCHPDDWVFQKREKAKVQSCRVPLHIAFHNYVSSRRALREAILRYEPVNIDDIHKDLVSYGHRYDPKDLLRFLDKKCITVKTTDNNARNKR